MKSQNLNAYAQMIVTQYDSFQDVMLIKTEWLSSTESNQTGVIQINKKLQMWLINSL